MAIVKHPHEASAVTLESKHQRYDRLRRLFGIRRLGDLFPPGSTPNGAAHDPAYCSGDVLRDLCQIGEYLKNKGVGRSERVERVKRVCLFSCLFGIWDWDLGLRRFGSVKLTRLLKQEFRAGEIVQHREIRELLARVKKNEFEERLKNMMKKEPGMVEEEDVKMMITSRDMSVFDHAAVAFTDKETYVNAFMPDAQAAIQRMQGSEEVEEVKYADTPGFATAEQIRASFNRRRSNVSPLKRKRDISIIEIKEEPVSSTQEREHEHENQFITTPKRNRFSKNPLTPHSARQIAQNTNTAPAKLAGRKILMGEKMMTMMGEDDSAKELSSEKRLKEVTDLVNHLDIMIGNAQKKLRGDVHGADALLTAARNLIGASLVGRAEWESTGLTLRESTGFTFEESVSHASREPAGWREESEDGV